MKKVGSCCTYKVLIVLFAALVVVFVGILVLYFVGIPRVVDNMIAASVRLEKGTEQWDRFLELPIPMVTRIYLFNLTNPDQILEGELPQVEEIGPYVYNQRINKSILSTDSSDDSVDYRKYTIAEFDPVLSGDRSESDLVTIVNAPLMVLTQITSAMEQLVVVGCLDKIFPPEFSKLIVTATIQKLMFEGIIFAKAGEDVGYACNIIRNQVIEKTKVMKNIQRIMNEDFPQTVDSLKFSLLGFKTQEPDGIYSVNRGIRDVSHLGNVMRWNNSTELPFWGRTQSLNNETCKAVRGGDSTIYAPQISKSTSLEIFSTDICRTVKLHYTGEGTYGGITGYRFEPNRDTFRPATPNAENDCFCTKRTVDPNGQPSCYLDGVFDLYDCFGAPLLLSFPHFMYADESYLSGVQGLTPANKSIHGIYLLIEPNTGSPLQGRKRVQINIVSRPIRHIPFASKLPSTVIPILWLDEGVDLSDDLLDTIKSKFFNVVKLVHGIIYGLIAVLAAALLVSGCIIVRKRCLKW